MSIIDQQDLAPLQESFQERLWAAQEAICKEIVAGLEGRQIVVRRKFREAGDQWTSRDVQVTPVDARIGDDDELILIGVYTHPHSGQLTETEIRI